MIAFLAAGLAYTIVFWAVCSKRPQIALMLIFASAPFQNDISGGGPLKFSLAEVNLLLSLPLLIFKGRPLVMRPLLAPIGLYLAIGVVASLLTWRDSSLICLIQTSLYWVFAPLVFAGLARTPKDYALALNGLVIIGAFLAIVGAASGSNYYLGLNKNGVGGSLGCAVVVGTELFLAAKPGKRRWLYACAVGITIGGLILTLSRGAWLATLTGFLVLFGLRRQMAMLVRVGLLAIPVVLLAWQALPAQSRSYALGISRENYSINARYINADMFKAHFRESPVVGRGVGLRKEIDATSIVWLTLAETGVLGLLAFGLVHVVFFSMLWIDQQGLSRSHLLYSLLGIGGALVAGRVAHGLFDHYWGRGPMMMAWAAAGMALFVHRVLPRMRREARDKARRAREAAETSATAVPALRCAA